MIEAYPLYFPENVKRTIRTVSSRFEKRGLSIAKLIPEIKKEVQLMKGKNLIISSNIRLKDNGLPYSAQRQPKDTGVAVWFTLNGGQRVLACDKYSSVEENLYAIVKTINAMRGIDRWGVSEIMERMFNGFLALPSDPYWKSVLGLEGEVTKEQLVTAYKKQAMQHHPDKGGSAEKFSEINKAYSQGLKELGLV